MTYLAQFYKATGGHQEVQPHWMPATGTRYILLNDLAILWLSLGFGKPYGFAPDPEDYQFLRWIGQKGHDFEAAWIKNCAPEAFQVAANDYDVRRAEEFRKTLLAMDAGLHVLTKVPLWSADLQVYGCADLLLSSDYFYERYPHLKPKVAEPPHFLVADAKFTSNLDGASKKQDFAINSAQVRLYSAMVGLIQGHVPKRAFFITRDQPDNPLPVEVNLSLDEPLNDMLLDLRNRYQYIKRFGADLLPWACTETAPGLSNDKTEPWTLAKKQIIAMLPNRPLECLPGIGKSKADAMRACGFEHVEQLLDAAPEANHFSQVRGIGPKINRTLQAVLRAHRTGKHTPIPASIVPSWCGCEMYVDYETLANTNVDFENDFPAMAGCPMIFQIGVGMEDAGTWAYRQFVAREESRNGERRLLDEFHAFLMGKGVFLPGNKARLWHWSSAEITCSASAASRQGYHYNWLRTLPWQDLQKVVKDSNIALPGCMGYSLKEFATALSKYDPDYAIEWPAGLDLGLSAMVAGWKMYERQDPMASPELALLTKYLEADVKSLWRILSWLRAHAEPRRISATAGARACGWYSYALQSQAQV